MDKHIQSPQILLLCANEASAQIDRRALRDAGYTQVQLMTSGIEAARSLAEIKGQPDIVICSHKLEDMDGEQFCAIIRQHPLLIGFPILLILPNADEAEQLKTLGCGASSLLGRPYSITELNKKLDSLRSLIPQQRMLHNAANDIDTSAFDMALATYGVLLKPDRDPEDYFRVGMRCLEERSWNLAINAFEHALRYAQLKAEAELGMAAAFKGKEDMRQCKEWLSRAAHTFVSARRWHHARAAYGKLLRHDPNAKNPFISEAHKLIRQGAYNEAAGVLAQGSEVTPLKDASDRYAQLCFAADDPAAMLNALEEGFSSDPHLNFLGDEIRQNLEVLAKEREERKRELAIERKWQLSRNLADKENSSKENPAAVKKHKPVETREEEAAVLFGEETEPAGDALKEQDLSIIEPLSQKDATSELFNKSPKLNELLSVVKLTWKLAKSKK